MGLHNFVALFEIMSHFTAFSAGLISNWLINGAGCLNFSLWGVGVIITLRNIDLLGNKFLLAALIGNAAIIIILRVSKGCLSRPISIRTESNFGGVLIDLDLLILNVAATKHT